MNDLLDNPAHREYVRLKTEREQAKLEQAMHERREMRKAERREEERRIAQKRNAPASIVFKGVTYVRADLVEGE